jgi:hypothetical protein
LLGLGDLQRALKLFDLGLRILDSRGLATAGDFFLPAAKEGFALAKKIVDRNATITTTSVAGKAT